MIGAIKLKVSSQFWWFSKHRGFVYARLFFGNVLQTFSMVSTSAFLFQRSSSVCWVGFGRWVGVWVRKSIFKFPLNSPHGSFYRFGPNHFSRVTPLMNKSCTWYSSTDVVHTKKDKVSGLHRMKIQFSSSEIINMEKLRKLFAPWNERKTEIQLFIRGFQENWFFFLSLALIYRFMHKRWISLELTTI